MSNYKEATVAGTAYVRAGKVLVENGLNEKRISFFEEDVVITSDGRTIASDVPGRVSRELTLENMGESFAVLDPVTGAGTGLTATFGEVYATLYSLYLYLATQRDALEASLSSEPPPDDPLPEPPVTEEGA